jgi:NAD-dependent deacetylase
MGDVFDSAAEALVAAKKVVAVTGAGISVESGIPDFRSADGLWAKYPPEDFATIDAFVAHPERVWQMWFSLGETLSGVGPNAAHQALADLERHGCMDAVITQNIDNLHEEAGSSKVIEYHGNAKRTFCLKCHRHAPFDLIACEGVPPRCSCSGNPVVKPDVVLFGELIPSHAMFESEALAQSADVVIIVGTSAQVYPAAGIPYTAKRHGAYIIECNVMPTEFTQSITNAFLEGKAATTLPELVNRVAALRDK